MILHDTKSCYYKLLQVDHPWVHQEAYAGNGRGEYVMGEGCAQIQPVVLDLLKLDIVFRVLCQEGCILIGVSEPHRWDEFAGEIQHVVARHLEKAK